jgi:quinoprotein relay system zinc metallohydrolase 2
MFALASAHVAAATFELSQIASGVYVHVGRQIALDAPGQDDIANIGFIAGSRCVAVIDTGGSVRVGRALRAAIKQRTPLPICYVINTHVHVDHVLGNAAFKPDQPAYIGHQGLADAIARNRSFFLLNYAGDLDDPPTPEQIIGPDRLVAVGTDLTLDLGDRSLVLHAWPKAHTDCDLTVYDDKTATLWTGDLLFRERLPALDGSVTGWLVAIDALMQLHPQWIVPGHGGVTRQLAAALAPERRYLQALVTGVRVEIAQGNSMNEAIDHVGISEKTSWLLWDATHPRNVARVYQELEWE